MEVKLVEEFDYSDKGSLFGKMDSMNDAIVKEIRECGNSVFITLHEFDDIESPSGEIIWPYKELEIEYEFSDIRNQHIWHDIILIGKWDKFYNISSITELPDLAKKKKIKLEMNDWMITAGGLFVLVFYPTPIYNPMTKKLIKTKDKIEHIEITFSYPQKIIYRWKA